MKRTSSALLFPLTLSLLLGGTGFWLNRATDLEISEVKLDPTQPQYEMNGISAARYDSQGLLQDNLTAQNAKMYPDSDHILFEKPQATMRENGKPLYNLVSEKGIYDSKTKQADFSGSVVITHYDDNGGIAGQMNTPALHIDELGANTQLPTLSQIQQQVQQNDNNTQRIKTVIYNVEQIKK